MPPLVDEQIWEDANKQIEENRKHNHSEPGRYTAADVLLYGGHVRCALCGYALLPHPHSLAAGDGKHRPPHTQTWEYLCRRWKQPDGSRCIGARISAHKLDAFVWHEAKRIIRDPEYLRSRLVQGKQETWSPEQQIAHYTELIAGCDADIQGWNAKYADLGGDPLLASTRAYLLDQIRSKALGRQEYVKKQDAAQAELVRRQQEQKRLAEFAAKASAQVPTLDDLDAAQRRQILLDLHPDVYIARPASDRPRIHLYFSLTAEAAAQVHDPRLWQPQTLQDSRGIQYVTFVETWPPTSNTDTPDGGFDISGVPEYDLSEDDPSNLEDDSKPPYITP